MPMCPENLTLSASTECQCEIILIFFIIILFDCLYISVSNSKTVLTAKVHQYDWNHSCRGKEHRGAPFFAIQSDGQLNLPVSL